MSRAHPAAPARRVGLPGNGAAAPGLSRLTLLLALLLAVAVGGPWAAQWAERQLAPAPAGPGSGVAVPPGPTSARGGRVAAARTGPEGGSPGAGREPAGPRGDLDREGRAAGACGRERELAARAAGPGVRRALARCLAGLGRDAYQADRAQAAVAYYRAALEADPETRELWAALALAYLKARDPDRAERAVEEALGRFPDEPELLYLLASLQERRGRNREAVETLRRLLGRQPQHARGRSLLAVLEREERVEGGYWSERSAHFLVRYEGAGGIDVGRSVVDILEEAYDSLGRELGVHPADRVQVGIYRREVLGEVIGVPAHYVRGAFDGRKIRLNLAESVAYSNDLSRLVRHEYAHLLVHLASRGRAPIWLHEGLAQVLEPRAAPRLLAASVPREALTLEGIERLSRTMDPVALTVGYQLTHVAVEHLVDRGGTVGVRELLGRLGRGEPLGPALRAVYGFGPEEVEARLLAVAGYRS